MSMVAALLTQVTLPCTSCHTSVVTSHDLLSLPSCCKLRHQKNTVHKLMKTCYCEAEGLQPLAEILHGTEHLQVASILRSKMI